MTKRTTPGRWILPMLLIIVLLFPASSFAASPGIPDYSGTAAIELNRGIPAFQPDSIGTRDSVIYSLLDSLGRAGAVTACLSSASLPTELREDELAAFPVGWETVRYDDGYLYRVCRLLSPALGGDSSAENAFTGTRFLRDEGMRLYEDRIADFLARTPYHVMYRATPVYHGSDLVPAGVQLEARSVEDAGKSLCFNVFLYNIQPGVAIDYRTGASVRDASVTVAFTAAEFLRLRSFPEPPEMVPPQHASFDALYQAFTNSGTVSGNTAGSTAALQRIMQLWVPESGGKYHLVNPCGQMNLDGAHQELVDLTTITASQLCETCCQPIIRSLDSLKASQAKASAAADSQSQAAPAPAASPTPQPTLTPAPTEKPESAGNSLLSGILSSALSTDTTMVWLSYADKCYHRTGNCPNVDSLSAYQKTLDWAKASGYTPCGSCW